MYAAVGSYIARVWRIFDFRFTRFPPLGAAAALAAGIYVNFFTHHWLPDAQVPLLVLTVLLLGRTLVWCKPSRKHLVMPLLLGFCSSLCSSGSQRISAPSPAPGLPRGNRADGR